MFETRRKTTLPSLGSAMFCIGLAAMVLVSGCTTISRWTSSLRFKDSQGRIIKDAKDIVIEAPDQRLPEKETLTYQVSWLGIPAGKAILSVKGVQNHNGRDCYVLEAVFKSSAVLSFVYKMQDRFVSYMDVEKLHTLRHEVYRRDGGYKKDAVTEFDQENHTAHFKNFIDNSEKNFGVPANIQDTLTACYYFMLMPLKVGDKVEYAVTNNEANYQLVGVVASKAFIWTAALGEKQAFLIQPYAKLKGEKVQKGDLKAYFSCDKRRIPLLGIIQGPVFTEVNFVLIKVEKGEKKQGEKQQGEIKPGENTDVPVTTGP